MKKNLSELIREAELIRYFGEFEQEIYGIELDSRKCEKNSLFVAIKGFETDGHAFIMKAIEKGATVVICETLPQSLVRHVCYVQVKNPREIFGKISQRFYENADEKLTKIAITGTNGKTSVSYFIRNISNLLEKKCGLIGTIEYDNGNNSIPSTHTTPEANILHQLFYEMNQNNCELCVMEISSHALALNRVENLKFEHAIFTNFSQDHLDFHKSMEDYFSAKASLFYEHLDGIAHLNADDEKIMTLELDETQTFGFSKNADIFLEKYELNSKKTFFSVNYKGFSYDFETPVIGEYNLYNLLASLDVFLSMNISISDLQAAFKKLDSVPGRMELQRIENRQVVVDYAHTPDAIENVLKTSRKISDGDLWIVFGCGGDRDKEKRPSMAEKAEKFSDKIVVTSDNSRRENPEKIIDDIFMGFSDISRVVRESNREKAIFYALENMKKDDFLVIAGKGHEKYQEIDGKRHFFSDQEVCKKWENHA
jgi:UDP-N-acetylmuramoyl-L-alanyl-D-glutamate--2,6-diaminopimelate ligase